MKKLFLLISLILVTTFLYAQGDATEPALTADEYFKSFATLVAGTLAITKLVTSIVSLKGFFAQIVSWVVAVCLCFVGYLLQAGVMIEATSPYHALIYGLIIGWGANGGYKFILYLKEITDNILKRLAKT